MIFRPPLNALLATALLVTACAGTGCQSAYYSAWEKLGYEKRDILSSRVKDARDDQEDAKKQIQTTLEQLQAITGQSGGDLESKYKKLNGEYEDSVSAAEDVRKRIASVEKVAKDMFAEWEKELGEYTDASMKASSQKQLRDTQERYGKLLSVMKAAEQRMDPVLAAFKNQVLFLKHNLNAAAISSLQGTAAQIETDVGTLIKDMEASIAEANAFISQMKPEK